MTRTLLLFALLALGACLPANAPRDPAVCRSAGTSARRAVLGLGSAVALTAGATVWAATDDRGIAAGGSIAAAGLAIGYAAWQSLYGEHAARTVSVCASVVVPPVRVPAAPLAPPAPR